MKNINQKGFTLIEFMLVSAIVVVLTTLGVINLANSQHKSQLSSTLDALTADIKQQQTKAMAGDAESDVLPASNYGIRFATTQYTLFRGTYGTANFVVTIPNTIQVTSTFSPSSDLIFLKGSGNVNGYTSSASATITLRDTVYNTQKTLVLNKLGVIMAIY